MSLEMPPNQEKMSLEAFKDVVNIETPDSREKILCLTASEIALESAKG